MTSPFTSPRSGAITKIDKKGKHTVERTKADLAAEKAAAEQAAAEKAAAEKAAKTRNANEKEA